VLGHYGIIGIAVFDGAAPNLAGTLMTFGEERRLWVMAGARGLSLLTAPLPGD